MLFKIYLFYQNQFCCIERVSIDIGGRICFVKFKSTMRFDCFGDTGDAKWCWEAAEASATSWELPQEKVVSTNGTHVSPDCIWLTFCNVYCTGCELERFPRKDCGITERGTETWETGMSDKQGAAPWYSAVWIEYAEVKATWSAVGGEDNTEEAVIGAWKLKIIYVSNISNRL